VLFNHVAFATQREPTQMAARTVASATQRAYRLRLGRKKEEKRRKKGKKKGQAQIAT
jgi:hypothetical protein